MSKAIPEKAERIELYRVGPGPSLAARLERSVLAFHPLKHSGERVLPLTWAAQ